jgi:hypothetical protein
VSVQESAGRQECGGNERCVTSEENLFSFFFSFSFLRATDNQRPRSTRKPFSFSHLRPSSTVLLRRSPAHRCSFLCSVYVCDGPGTENDSAGDLGEVLLRRRTRKPCAVDLVWTRRFFLHSPPSLPRHLRCSLSSPPLTSIDVVL